MGAVEILQGNPLFTDCQFQNGGGPGVHVEGCWTVPVFRGCRVHGCGVGVLVSDHALATLEGGDIDGNGEAGVEAITGGRLHLERCRVTHNGGPAVSLRRHAVATLLDCQLGGNAGPDLCAEGATVSLGPGRLTHPDPDEPDAPLVVGVPPSR